MVKSAPKPVTVGLLVGLCALAWACTSNSLADTQKAAAPAVAAPARPAAPAVAPRGSEASMQKALLLAEAPRQAQAKADAPPAVSDVLKVPRPEKGEYMGIYMMGKKVGYMFSQVKAAGDGTVVYVNEMNLIAQQGNGKATRVMRDTRVYESKPKGRLLSFLVEQLGDGGDQILEGKATPEGVTVKRRRPSQPDEVRTLPPAKEVVEDADQARVALLRNQKVEGTILDGMDLDMYGVTTTIAPQETRTLKGVKVTLKHAVTLSAKEKVPMDAYVDEQGRMVEVRFGPTMVGTLEPEEMAKRVDRVEVLALTRVVLPAPPPPTAKTMPGFMRLIMTGLPDSFRVTTYRQAFKALPGGKVEVYIHAEPPRKRSARPLKDPEDGKNLKSTIIVEADNPDIIAVATRVAGQETDAWTTAKKVSTWVHDNMKTDYGASADHATDVLRTMRGDCTEHALLTVAMLRALGVPAKRVDGVVYVMNSDQVPALYWHEWVEAWVGEWTQLDPTFGHDVADATHFAVGEEAGAEITPLMGTMKVLEVH